MEIISVRSCITYTAMTSCIYDGRSHLHRRAAAQLHVALLGEQDRQYTYHLSMRRARATTCCSGTAIRISYSECVFVALGIQHAKRMRHIVICCLSGYTLFFSVLSHKRHDFRKRQLYWTQNVCFAFLYNFCLKLFFFFVLRRNGRDVIKNGPFLS